MVPVEQRQRGALELAKTLPLELDAAGLRNEQQRLVALLVVKFALVVAAVIGVLAVLRIAFGVAA